MQSIIEGFKSNYEIERLIKMHFGRCNDSETSSNKENCIEVRLLKVNERNHVVVKLLWNTRQSVDQREALEDTTQTVFLAARMIAYVAESVGLPPLRWGILTGIRPIKIVRKMLEQGQSEQNVAQMLRESYLVQSEIADVVLEIAHREIEINKILLSNGVSLYVSIPFCPSRCSYCSFVSQSIGKEMQLIAHYLDCICEEMKITAELIKSLKLTLQTVYIGGGTPTCLGNDQLAGLLNTINECFDLSESVEITIEAGRPETLNIENLTAIKSCKINRICINPQSLNDAVLIGINRNHTAQDVEKAYRLAREVGFQTINMDLIAGLPGESLESFKNSLIGVAELAPENITVHTLTIKRGSDYSCVSHQSSPASEIVRMVDFSREYLANQGYKAYYLYRQAGTLANLENIGYSKPGYEGIYNSFMMGETQTVLAVGAAGVTKLVHPISGKIKRIYNNKLPREYIRSFSEVINRKEGVLQFYESSV